MRRKRGWAALLALALLAPALALAYGYAGRGTEELPECYRYVLAGQSWCYSDAPVTVYSENGGRGAALGQVYPGQEIHTESWDPQTGWAYIEADGVWGWIPARFDYGMTELPMSVVVTTDRPGNRLNLRASPSRNAASYGKYYAGTVAIRTGEERNGFVRVRIGHAYGWFDRRYLADGAYTPTEELPRVRVTRGALPVRKQPSARSEETQRAFRGDVLTVLAVRTDGYTQVVYENEIGYVETAGTDSRLRY